MLFNTILDLAINMRVVTQIDSKINVLDIESSMDNGEIGVMEEY
jgi:hypothetical protein